MTDEELNQYVKSQVLRPWHSLGIIHARYWDGHSPGLRAKLHVDILFKIEQNMSIIQARTATPLYSPRFIRGPVPKELLETT
jgi:hypothetical protein